MRFQLLLPLLPLAVAAQRPATVPERTAYARTSTTDEVRRFLDSLVALGAPIAVTSLGTSAGGTDLPLVIASAPRVTTAAEARATGRLVVYLQANIHGGEVEGKEAVQMLLRDLLGPERTLLERLVLLVAPVYNADGNDALGPQQRNRRSQDGPALVGLRPDGWNLDLNRDYLKAEAPETRAALARVITAWDPAVMMDLHTTNGTLHGYRLTYAPPLDPNGPAGPTAFVRDRLLPAVRAALGDTMPVFDYGNVGEPDPDAWVTYSPLGWFGINYAGLRGRLAILSEAYSHDSFRQRVEATDAFVRATLRYVAAHADEIRAVIAEADRTTAAEGAAERRPDLAIAWEPAARGTEPVLLEVEGTVRPTRMPVFDRFRATETRPLPAGYYLPPAETGVVDLLRRHGIAVERLQAVATETVEAVALDSVAWAPRPFQGHHLLTVRGHYRREERELPAGTWFVSTAQPLGRLVFTLLEPEGPGLAQWNAFDRLLGAQFGAPTARTFPVVRALRAPAVARTVVP